MKNKLLLFITATMLLLSPCVGFAQAPTLGTAASFVMFSSNGAVSNTGISQLTGNVGTNSGSSTAFGNVNGGMHDGDSVSSQCSSDLLIAYNQLNSAIPTFFISTLLGNGDTLIAGIYSVGAAATLNSDLILDAEGDANAVFIFQVSGSFSTNADAKVKLINGAKACNVFWKVEGLVSMSSGTTMRGTVIANNAAINMNTGDTLEGRVLTTNGAISIDGGFAYTPIGCGSPTLNGPVAPTLGSAAFYGLFSSDGDVSNTGITQIAGDVGTNNGSTTGFDTSLVDGEVHLLPDSSTAQCAADLLVAYNYVNTLPYDIELLYPAQFGSNLVLTPHTYLMNGAVTFTDTVYLNALDNSNAVFVIQINGALSTSTYSRVVLINGAQAKNVYWKIEGAVSINNYSVFCGTIICNNAALGAFNTGVVLNGRALTTAGALTTNAITTNLPVQSLDITGTTPGSICGPGKVTLAATASAGTINWYTAATGGSSLATGETYTTATLSVNDTFYVEATLGNISTPTRTAIIATVKTIPTITGTIPNTICGSGAVILGASSSAGIINWYSTLVGGVSLATGASYTTPVILVTDTLYVDATVSGCTTKIRTAIIAKVSAVPTITATTPGAICGNGNAVLGATASAGVINWYSTLTGGSSLATGTSYTTPVMSVTDTFYVDATVGNCITTIRTSVLARVNAIPTITATTPASIIGSGTVTLLATASAGIINWYADAVGGSSLATGTSYTTPVLSLTDTFYVDATAFSCTSLTRTMVIATVSMNTGVASYVTENAVSVYPNPFTTTIQITINDISQINNCELKMFNMLGAEVITKAITTSTTTLDRGNLPSGVYFYQIIGNNKSIQSGRVIAQ